MSDGKYITLRKADYDRMIQSATLLEVIMHSESYKISDTVDTVRKTMEAMNRATVTVEAWSDDGG